MTHALDSALARLQDEVATILSEMGWGLHRQVSERLAGVSIPTSGGECSARLEEFPVDQALFHLPAVMRYLAAFTRAVPSWKDDLDWAGRAVGLHLKVAQDHPRMQGVQCRLTDLLMEIIVCWNREFPPPPDLHVRNETSTDDWVHHAGFPTAGLLLESLLESEGKRAPRSLFTLLLDRWCAIDGHAESSATLLLLFLFVKHSSAPLSLFRDSRMLDCAFNVKICQRHWLIAERIVREKTVEAVGRAMQGDLAFP